MANAFQSRDLVRAVPFSTPQVFVGSLNANASKTFIFDVFVALADRSQINTQAANLVGTPTCSGHILDAFVFSDQAGSLDCLVQVLDPPGVAIATTPHSIMPGGTPIVIAASTPGVIAGLRVPAQQVQVTYLNTAVVPANVEFTVVVRSI